MRPFIIAAFLACCGLTACGSDEPKTVVVQPTQPQPNSTVVVPGTTKVCPAGYTTC